MLEVVHGNRGLCAQPCRLPYTLIDENNTNIDTGYLLSPRDLNGVNFLPSLIKMGISCFKIEGRLKSPEYVAITTKFYRKYIDLVWQNQNLSNEEILKLINKELSIKNPQTNLTDLEEILQVFNRGNFSNGHLDENPNQNLIFKEKSNNSGFYLGKVEKINANKGYITLKLENTIAIGDKISIDSKTYTISELMENKNNIRTAFKNQTVTIGRIKGNIKNNMKIFKLENKVLTDSISPTFLQDKEFKKIPLIASLSVLKNEPISIEIKCNNENSIYYNEKVKIISDIMPTIANNNPITQEKIKEQISKTGNTMFYFENINVNLDDNLFIPKFNIFKEIRRIAIEKLQNNIINKEITSRNLIFKPIINHNSNYDCTTLKISLLLNIINKNTDYSSLYNIDKLYIPLKYFLLKEYKSQISALCEKFNIFIYMPNIIKDNIKVNYNILKDFNFKGVVISNISQINLFEKKTNLIGNYTLNVFNSQTLNYLKKLGINEFCITPELNDKDSKELLNSSPISSEMLVYGKIPFMTMNYCLLGCTNKCYKNCKKLCKTNKKFYLKDRLNFNFRIVPDSFLGTTTIYNSKITSFEYSKFKINVARISILDESISEIQNIINTVRNNKKFEGNSYTRSF